jgi:DNA-binding NtrC family response regulator
MRTPVAPPDEPVVLVVDDDEMVRGLVAAALLRAGFTVTLAVGGQQAVEVYSRRHGEVAVVLLGVQMPGLDGPRTSGLLRAVNPAVRYGFVSGHLGEEEAAGSLPQGASRVSHKPFNPEALRGLATER